MRLEKDASWAATRRKAFSMKPERQRSVTPSGVLADARAEAELVSATVEKSMGVMGVELVPSVIELGGHMRHAVAKSWLSSGLSARAQLTAIACQEPHER